jgi:hypothetical protein
MALVALLVAGVLAVGSASAAAAPKAAKPAKAEKVKKEKKPRPAAVKAAPKPVAAKPAKTPRAKPVEKTYEERRALDGPWAKGANWMWIGAGYARSGGQNAGDALGGYGVGYQHMLGDRWSFGSSIHHEILGHIGNSYEISVPMTAEFTRHFKWKTAMRPYLGIGGGYYFHKFYRTTHDYTGAPAGGWHVSFGTDLPLDDRHVLGLETHVGFIKGRGETVVNPVFGPERSAISIWSVKLNWALVH